MFQDNPGEKWYQNHKLLTFQLYNKKPIPHCPQRYATLNDFFGLQKSNYWIRYVQARYLKTYKIYKT